MYRKLLWLAAGILSIVFVASSSQARTLIPYLDELRIGGTAGTTNYRSGNLELQALFSPLSLVDRIYNPQMGWLFAPRPFIGVSVSLDHQTDQLYGGLAWTVPILGPYFVELQAGGLIHDQALNVTYPDRVSPLSTRMLFRGSIAIGYNIDANWRVLLFADHGSNGDLGYRNEGVNRVGFLIGRHIGPAHPKPPPTISSAETFDWTGPYVGFNGGLARGTLEINAAGASAQNSPSSSVNLGALLGYNWSIGRFVLGSEADYSLQHLTTSKTVDQSLPSQQELSATSSWLFTAGPRLGMKINVPYVSDPTLIYGTGGIAVGSITKGYCNTATAKCYQNGDVAGGWSGQHSTRIGWTAGVGLEMPLTPIVAARFEYRYVDLGSATFTNGSLLDEISFTENLLSAGMTFKLN